MMRTWTKRVWKENLQSVVKRHESDGDCILLDTAVANVRGEITLHLSCSQTDIPHIYLCAMQITTISFSRYRLDLAQSSIYNLVFVPSAFLQRS